MMLLKTYRLKPSPEATLRLNEFRLLRTAEQLGHQLYECCHHGCDFRHHNHHTVV